MHGHQLYLTNGWRLLTGFWNPESLKRAIDAQTGGEV